MTEQQIIETLATQVMGWKIGAFYDDHNRLRHDACFEDGHGFVLFLNKWNPLRNIADAWMIVEKFGSMPYDDIRRIRFMALMPVKIYDITSKSICETAFKAIA